MHTPLKHLQQTLYSIYTQRPPSLSTTQLVPSFPSSLVNHKLSEFKFARGACRACTPYPLRLVALTTYHLPHSVCLLSAYTSISPTQRVCFSFSFPFSLCFFLLQAQVLLLSCCCYCLGQGREVRGAWLVPCFGSAFGRARPLCVSGTTWLRARSGAPPWPTLFTLREIYHDSIT